MIQLNHISYSYGGVMALDDISFEINKDEKVVLMGVNGSGKSTILKLLDGLIFPQEGSYLFNGEFITKKRLKNNSVNACFRSKVVMLFQKPDVMLFNPTVYDELAFAPRQLKNKDIDDEVKYWADKFNISHLLNKQPFNLSCGEKKKVALASLLIINPKILLLDEPFSYLDSQSIEWMIDFLTHLDKTIIISMHNLKIASLLSNRLLALSNNHGLIYDGNLNEFLSSERKMRDAGMFTNLKEM